MWREQELGCQTVHADNQGGCQQNSRGRVVRTGRLFNPTVRLRPSATACVGPMYWRPGSRPRFRPSPAARFGPGHGRAGITHSNGAGTAGSGRRCHREAVLLPKRVRPRLMQRPVASSLPGSSTRDALTHRLRALCVDRKQILLSPIHLWRFLMSADQMTY